MFFAADAGRLFGLDMQLIFGMIFQMISIFLLFTVLTYLLFEPVRTVLKNRKERIAKELERAGKAKSEAEIYKKEYETKRNNAEKEAEELLKEARKKALWKEKDIISNARKEAEKTMEQGEKEAELFWKKAEEEVRRQSVDAAVLMAEKILLLSLDAEAQEKIIQKTVKDMTEATWQLM